MTLALLGAGAIVLQVLGPPESQLTAPPPGPAQPTAPVVAVPTPPAAKPFGASGRSVAGPIAPPDPALLEPAASIPGGLLPRIAPDGRTSMQVYAAGFDRSNARPRVGLLLVGVGLNESDSEDAIRTLPGGISLGFSPYAPRLQKLLDAARLAGHEFLISIPMEPQGYPLNDAGNQALLTGASVAQNRQRLDWVLTGAAGYVGATGGLGALRGERFASVPELLNPVLQTLASRGLLYVDARPKAPGPSSIWGRSVDLVVDEPASRPEIETKLAQLEQLARDRGSALGLATAIRPVTVDRLAAWANGLAARGLALAPVSALVQPPGPDGAMR